jgi:glycosyltransferase involved in cell wall biosynthesis
MADVLVSPRSYGGNLPLKVFDYLAAGRPIVATDLPTHRTVLSEDRAVLVEPETGAIAEGLLAVLRDPEQAARLADAARRYAEEHLAWNTWVRCVGQLYADVHRHAPPG